ncbi:hypothetical protein BGW80DRAFT_1267886 [Lactifluus volemus]|nr:hypothetical protein BGW80DRAFT_1267886 [Lactifluus volemus]
MRSFKIISLVILYRFAQCVSADTSLFISGFDPQPLSVNNLGVDKQGRTTWEIAQGSPTGTFNQVPFTGTATLFEGPTDPHLAYVNLQQSLTLDFQCGISDRITACTAADDYRGLLSIIYATMPVQL